ncbi:MAG TPA: c-type cytochrome [Steroidobacteraceae bacterium]|jgi:cytochrome c oxidase cbb3-type subunit 3|nr:c-type cytochrome [Steroidobacteraceae bacterium]
MRFVVVVLSLSIAAGVFAERGFTEHRMLRADPDRLASDGALLRIAVRRGAPLFLARCAVCHGAQGKGDPHGGIPDLTDDDWLYGTGRVAEIERVIDYGIRSRNSRAFNLAVMPAYARQHPSPTDNSIQPLRPAELGDLIEFLMQRQGRRPDIEAASRGAALFGGRAGCFDCHSPDAKGDPAIGAPNLTDGITLYGDGSRSSLFMSIAYGRQGVCPAWISRLSAADIRQLALYVYSISHPGTIQNAH